MGKGRGRPPKPTALKILEGNPGKRPLNLREPKPEVGVMRCPDNLDAEASAEWRRIVKAMPKGLLTKVDRAGLAMLCETWSEYVEARKINNLMRVDKARSAWLRLAGEFGLTPSSRTRLSVDVSKSDQDDLAAFLGETG